MVERTGAVGDARVEDAAVVRVNVVLWRAVQEHVHVGADVHVAHLQRACEREDERDELLLGRLLAYDLDVGFGSGRQAARERRVAVDVELEEMEEGVADKGDRAVDLGLDAVLELERFAGFLADGEGDPLELVVVGLDMLAGLPGGLLAFRTDAGLGDHGHGLSGDSRAPVHALDVDGRLVLVGRELVLVHGEDEWCQDGGGPREECGREHDEMDEWVACDQTMMQPSTLRREHRNNRVRDRRGQLTTQVSHCVVDIPGPLRCIETGVRVRVGLRGRVTCEP